MNREAPPNTGPDADRTAEADTSLGGARNSAHPDVDVSQIEELLTLTPAQRLMRLEQALLLMEELRNAGRRYYGFDPRAVIEAKQASS
jgi:hypothetical protein